jgi:hypothetical protein
MRWIQRQRAVELAKAKPEQVSLLYADELSLYKRPTLAGAVFTIHRAEVEDKSPPVRRWPLTTPGTG